jgi:hypothetical protein
VRLGPAGGFYGAPSGSGTSGAQRTLVGVSHAYFPLRSSVELFADPQSPEPVSRAKHAAIVYDEITFEIGMFETTITGDGAFSRYVAPDSITEDDRRNARRVIGEGEGVRIDIKIRGEEGEPALEIAPFFSGQVVAKYASEWHTGVLDELRRTKPSWVNLLSVSDDTIREKGLAPAVAEIKRLLEQANLADRADLMHSNFVIGALSRDAAVAATQEASVLVTSLFRPILFNIEGVSLDRQGQAALEIVLPNVAGLPWEAISEFREHPGSQDARGKLRSVEERAAADGLEPSDFTRRVAEEITSDLLAALTEQKGSAAKKLAKEAVNTAVSLVPVVGTVLGPGVSLSETITEVVKDRRSWHAALMQLKDKSG